MLVTSTVANVFSLAEGVPVLDFDNDRLDFAFVAPPFAPVLVEAVEDFPDESTSSFTLLLEDLTGKVGVF